MATDKPKFKFPKSMGLCADKLYDLKERRLAISKEASKLNEEETALRAYIIESLPKSDALGAAGKVARVTVTSKKIPTVTDMDKLLKYVKRSKGNEDLLTVTTSMSVPAVKARWEDGKIIPGVGVFNVISLSMNKL